MQRAAMSKGSSFSSWMEEKQAADLEASGEGGGGGGDPQSSFSLLGQLSSIQDSFSNQLQELSGSIPEAGPLSAAFRQRVTHAIYLLLASFGFAGLAILIGLPTLIVRPAKFVVCMSLSTLFAALSVIVLQKPAVFLSSLLTGGAEKIFPVALLFASLLFTLYVTIFVHKYMLVLACGIAQVFCILFYLSTFIPGGQKGLLVLLRAGYSVLHTALTPVRMCLRASLASFFRTIWS